MTTEPRILVIDDGETYAEMVGDHLPEVKLLAPLGDGEPSRLPDGPAAIDYLASHAGEVDVVLLDMHFDVAEDRLLPLGQGASAKRTRRFQGVAILRALRHAHPDLPVVLLTSVEDLSLVDMDGELAAQSMTYVLDGDDLDTLRIRISAALREREQGLEEESLLWGRDRAMQAMRRRLAVLARGSLPVLLEGETGTGKSYLAEHFVHANSGRKGPFVTLDLSTVPSELISAHLFGAEKGSYTGSVADRKGVFELAHGGTLFIDEVQSVPVEVQKQLLVVLQDRRVRPIGAAHEVEVDVKVIAATNRPLVDAVAAGRFREDLYMRLGPATRVQVPPLRARPEDLPFLARRLVARAAEDPDNSALRAEVAEMVLGDAQAPLSLSLGRDEERAGELELVVPTPVWQQLADHPWPGNMRELATVTHSLVSFTLVAAVDAIRSGVRVSSSRLQVDTGLVGELLSASGGLVRQRARQTVDEDGIVVRLAPAKTLNGVANDVERQYMVALFERTQGDFGQMAAELLGDAGKGRAVRLRFNQLGLKVRELRKS